MSPGLGVSGPLLTYTYTLTHIHSVYEEAIKLGYKVM